MYPDFAQIIRLCYNVFYAASSFSFFFYVFVVLFALIYRTLGNDTGGHPDPGHGDGNDYERINSFAALVMYSYRTSIGDLEAPNAQIWEDSLGKSNMYFMVYLTWVVWMVHQYFMLIVFLNFLIAIVSQVYENDLAKTLQNDYTQKAEMNLEAEHLLTAIGFME